MYLNLKNKKGEELKFPLFEEGKAFRKVKILRENLVEITSDDDLDTDSDCLIRT